MPEPVAVESVEVDRSLQAALVRHDLLATAPRWAVGLALGLGLAVATTGAAGTSVVAAVVVLVVMLLLLRARAKAQRRRHPIGSRLGCGIGQGYLRVDLDGVDRLVHLSRVSADHGAPWCG